MKIIRTYNYLDTLHWTEAGSLSCLLAPTTREMIAFRIQENLSRIYLTHKFFNYFKPVNIKVRVCEITNTVEIKVNNTVYFGFTTSNSDFQVSILDNSFVVNMPYTVVFNPNVFYPIKERVRSHWELLDTLALLHNGPYPYSTSYAHTEVNNMLNGKPYDPIGVLSFINQLPARKSTDLASFMYENKEAIILKLALVANGSTYAPKYIDDQAFNFPLEFIEL